MYRLEFELAGLPPTTCRVCNQGKPRFRAEKDARGKYHYRDDRGNLWQGRRCHACSLAAKITDGRKRGKRPIDDVENHAQKLGRQSEVTAKRHFERLGYSVRMTTANGPDLTISKDGAELTVEVKTVTKVKGRNCWYIHEVMPLRRGDDLIAIVHGESVFVEDMKEHLAKTPKSGVRVVTNYVQA